MAYFWIKTFHVVFVIAWMAAVFYLPRILVNIAEADQADEPPAVRKRLVLMGLRLYRFGHIMFGLALALGLVLWFAFGIHGGWLYAKLVLVAGLLAFYAWSGVLLKGIPRGQALPSAKLLRLCNELPVLLLVGILYLVFAKPF